MDPDVLQALQDLGLEDPQAAAEEIKNYMEQVKEQVKEQVIERVLDYFSDKWGIGRSELEPVIIQLAGSVSLGGLQANASLQVVDADGSKSCEKCLFWHQYKKRVDQGECRRFAPQHLDAPPPDALGGLVIKNRGIWPVTINSDWCGEFKAKE